MKDILVNLQNSIFILWNSSIKKHVKFSRLMVSNVNVFFYGHAISQSQPKIFTMPVIQVFIYITETIDFSFDLYTQ